MNKRRVFVFIWSAILAWVIVNIYRMEVKKRGEMVALCAAYGDGIKVPELSDADPSAKASIEWIASVAGIAPNFAVYEGDHVPSVAFAAIKDGERIIVYDAKTFSWTNKAARWRDVVVMAHEVGHHLGGHLIARSGDAHARELEADQFSGYAVSMLGATLAQALSFSDEFPDEDSETHPARAKRRDAIMRGWMKGDEVKRGSRR